MGPRLGKYPVTRPSAGKVAQRRGLVNPASLCKKGHATLDVARSARREMPSDLILYQQGTGTADLLAQKGQAVEAFRRRVQALTHFPHEPPTTRQLG